MRSCVAVRPSRFACRGVPGSRLATIAIPDCADRRASDGASRLPLRPLADRAVFVEHPALDVGETAADLAAQPGVMLAGRAGLESFPLSLGRGVLNPEPAKLAMALVADMAMRSKPGPPRRRCRRRVLRSAGSPSRSRRSSLPGTTCGETLAPSRPADPRRRVVERGPCGISASRRRTRRPAAFPSSLKRAIDSSALAIASSRWPSSACWIPWCQSRLASCWRSPSWRARVNACSKNARAPREVAQVPRRRGPGVPERPSRRSDRRSRGRARALARTWRGRARAGGPPAWPCPDCR